MTTGTWQCLSSRTANENLDAPSPRPAPPARAAPGNHGPPGPKLRGRRCRGLGAVVRPQSTRPAPATRGYQGLDGHPAPGRGRDLPSVLQAGCLPTLRNAQRASLATAPRWCSRIRPSCAHPGVAGIRPAASSGRPPGRYAPTWPPRPVWGSGLGSARSSSSCFAGERQGPRRNEHRCEDGPTGPRLLATPPVTKTNVAALRGQSASDTPRPPGVRAVAVRRVPLPSSPVSVDLWLRAGYRRSLPNAPV